jgi:AcrR family transcriptional regulator
MSRGKRSRAQRGKPAERSPAAKEAAPAGRGAAPAGRGAAPAAEHAPERAAPARPSRGDATRDALLRVGRQLFAERGFAGVGTEEIVAEAGVTRGALYHHFADKRDLFRAVHEQLEQALVTDIGERIGGIEDPWELIVTGVRAFLDSCTDPAVRRIALLDAPAVLGWAEWREIDARYGLGLIGFGLQNAMDRGVLAQRPVRPLAHLLMGAMAEAAMVIANADDPAAARDEVEAPLLALIEGLGN